MNQSSNSLPRISRSQIPRPDFDDSKSYRYDTCAPEGTRVFPLATSNFIAIDEGISSPRFTRSSIRCLPNTKDILTKSLLPLAVEVIPMAVPAQGEDSIPIVDFGVDGPIRCRICKAYVNSYAIFTSQGDQWRCNFCEALNEVPPYYRCSLDGFGLRKDRFQHPELCKGSVDFVVPNEYCIRPIQDPIFVFSIDVSARALLSGFTTLCIDAINLSLDSIPGESAKIGIITFNHSIHFYNIVHNQVRMVVMVDVDEPSPPLPLGSWLYDLATSKKQIEKLLHQIPELIGAFNLNSEKLVHSNSIPFASIAAIHALAESLKSVGGKIILMSQSPPLNCIGSVTRMDKNSSYGTAEELRLIQPSLSDAELPHMLSYKGLAERLSESQICLDMILLQNDNSSHFFDIATLGLVTHATGGQIAYISHSASQNEVYRQVASTVHKILSSYIAREAVFKVRCSIGLRCENLIGLGVEKVLGELEIAGLSCHQSILCNLSYDFGQLVEGKLAFIQAVLLYTSLSGKRLVRCHTLALSISSQPVNVYKSLDVEVITSYLLRTAAHNVLFKPLMVSMQQHSIDMIRKVVKILSYYRKTIATDSSDGQLVLPESLRVLPLYSLCIQKCIALRKSNVLKSGIHPRVDERSWFLFMLQSMCTRDIIDMVYPRFYMYHLPENNTGIEIVPNRVAPTSEKISGFDVCLIETNVSFTLYISIRVSSNVIAGLLGENPSLGQNKRLELAGNSELSNIIRSHIAERRQKCTVAKPIEVVIANSGTLNEELFISLLVEDLTQHGISYDEHIVAMHKTIQHQLQYTSFFSIFAIHHTITLCQIISSK